MINIIKAIAVVALLNKSDEITSQKPESQSQKPEREQNVEIRAMQNEMDNSDRINRITE